MLRRHLVCGTRSNEAHMAAVAIGAADMRRRAALPIAAGLVALGAFCVLAGRYDDVFWTTAKGLAALPGQPHTEVHALYQIAPYRLRCKPTLKSESHA